MALIRDGWAVVPSDEEKKKKKQQQQSQPKSARRPRGTSPGEVAKKQAMAQVAKAAETPKPTVGKVGSMKPFYDLLEKQQLNRKDIIYLQQLAWTTKTEGMSKELALGIEAARAFFEANPGIKAGINPKVWREEGRIENSKWYKDQLAYMDGQEYAKEHARELRHIPKGTDLRKPEEQTWLAALPEGFSSKDLTKAKAYLIARSLFGQKKGEKAELYAEENIVDVRDVQTENGAGFVIVYDNGEKKVKETVLWGQVPKRLLPGQTIDGTATAPTGSTEPMDQHLDMLVRVWKDVFEGTKVGRTIPEDILPVFLAEWGPALGTEEAARKAFEALLDPYMTDPDNPYKMNPEVLARFTGTMEESLGAQTDDKIGKLDSIYMQHAQDATGLKGIVTPFESEVYTDPSGKIKWGLAGEDTLRLNGLLTSAIKDYSELATTLGKGVSLLESMQTKAGGAMNMMSIFQTWLQDVDPNIQVDGKTFSPEMEKALEQKQFYSALWRSYADPNDEEAAMYLADQGMTMGARAYVEDYLAQALIPQEGMSRQDQLLLGAETAKSERDRIAEFMTGMAVASKLPFESDVSAIYKLYKVNPDLVIPEYQQQFAQARELAGDMLSTDFGNVNVLEDLTIQTAKGKGQAGRQQVDTAVLAKGIDSIMYSALNIMAVDLEKPDRGPTRMGGKGYGAEPRSGEGGSFLRAAEQFFNFFHHGVATVHEAGQTATGQKIAEGESIRPEAQGANKFGTTSFERHENAQELLGQYTQYMAIQRLAHPGVDDEEFQRGWTQFAWTWNDLKRRTGDGGYINMGTYLQQESDPNYRKGDNLLAEFFIDAAFETILWTPVGQAWKGVKTATRLSDALAAKRAAFYSRIGQDTVGDLAVRATDPMWFTSKGIDPADAVDFAAAKNLDEVNAIAARPGVDRLKFDPSQWAAPMKFRMGFQQMVQARPNLHRVTMVAERNLEGGSIPLDYRAPEALYQMAIGAGLSHDEATQIGNIVARMLATGDGAAAERALRKIQSFAPFIDEVNLRSIKYAMLGKDEVLDATGTIPKSMTKRADRLRVLSDELETLSTQLDNLQKNINEHLELLRQNKTGINRGTMQDRLAALREERDAVAKRLEKVAEVHRKWGGTKSYRTAPEVRDLTPGETALGRRSFSAQERANLQHNTKVLIDDMYQLAREFNLRRPNDDIHRTGIFRKQNRGTNGAYMVEMRRTAALHPEWRKMVDDARDADLPLPEMTDDIAKQYGFISDEVLHRWERDTRTRVQTKGEKAQLGDRPIGQMYAPKQAQQGGVSTAVDTGKTVGPREASELEKARRLLLRDKQAARKALRRIAPQHEYAVRVTAEKLRQAGATAQEAAINAERLVIYHAATQMGLSPAQIKNATEGAVDDFLDEMLVRELQVDPNVVADIRSHWGQVVNDLEAVDVASAADSVGIKTAASTAASKIRQRELAGFLRRYTAMDVGDLRKELAKISRIPGANWEALSRELDVPVHTMPRAQWPKEVTSKAWATTHRGADGKPVVYIDEAGLADSFKHKRWLYPKHNATGLEMDAFESLEEYRDFVIFHELAHSQTPSVRVIKESAEEQMGAIVNHSGGAAGADSLWDDVGQRFGVTQHRHYYVDGIDPSTGQPFRKPPRGNTPISEAVAKEADTKIAATAKVLGKNAPRKPPVLALIRRNWQQVKNADEVFAICEIADGLAQGGTGWAVHMAIVEGKPVHVFSKSLKKWRTWKNGQWVDEATPTLPDNFAGIGSREAVSKTGVPDRTIHEAIAEVYEKTVAQRASGFPVDRALREDLATRDALRTMRGEPLPKYDVGLKPGTLPDPETLANQVREEAAKLKTARASRQLLDEDEWLAQQQPNGKWVVPDDADIMDEGLLDHPREATLDVNMTPEEYLAESRHPGVLLAADDPEFYIDPTFGAQKRAQGGQLAAIRKRFEAGEAVDPATLDVYIDEDGIARIAKDSTQQGDHRAMVAAEMGMDNVPVRLQVWVREGSTRRPANAQEMAGLQFQRSGDIARWDDLADLGGPATYKEYVRDFERRMSPDGRRERKTIEKILDQRTLETKPVENLRKEVDSINVLLQQAEEISLEAIEKGSIPPRVAGDFSQSAQPLVPSQMQHLYQPPWDTREALVWRAGPLARRIEEINTHPRGFFWVTSLDRASNVFKTVILARIATAIRIVFADEFTRLLPEQIDPIQAHYYLKEMLEYEAKTGRKVLPADLRADLTRLYGVIRKSSYVPLDPMDADFISAYTGMMDQWLADPVVQTWRSAYRRAGGGDKGLEAAKAELAAQTLQPNSAVALHLRLTNRQWPHELTMKDTFAAMGSKKQMEKLRTAFEQQNIDQWIEAAHEQFAFFANNPYTAKHFIGDASGKVVKPKPRDFKNHSWGNRGSAIADEEQMPIVMGRANMGDFDQHWYMPQVWFGNVLEGISGELTQHVYAHFYTAQRTLLISGVAKNLRKQGVDLDYTDIFAVAKAFEANGMADELTRIEEMAMAFARTQTQKVMYTAGTAAAEDLLRNIILFLPAQRQYIAYWAKAIFQNPVLLAYFHRLDQMPDYLEFHMPGTDENETHRLYLRGLLFATPGFRDETPGQKLYQMVPGFGLPGVIMGGVAGGAAKLGVEEPQEYMQKLPGGDFYKDTFRPLNSSIAQFGYAVSTLIAGEPAQWMPEIIAGNNASNLWKFAEAMRAKVGRVLDGEEGRVDLEQLPDLSTGGKWNEARSHALKALVTAGWNFLVPMKYSIVDRDAQEFIDLSTDWDTLTTYQERLDFVTEHRDSRFVKVLRLEMATSDEERQRLIARDPGLIPYYVSNVGFISPEGEKFEFEDMVEKSKQTFISKMNTERSLQLRKAADAEETWFTEVYLPALRKREPWTGGNTTLLTRPEDAAWSPDSPSNIIRIRKEWEDGTGVWEKGIEDPSTGLLHKGMAELKELSQKGAYLSASDFASDPTSPIFLATEMLFKLRAGARFVRTSKFYEDFTDLYRLSHKEGETENILAAMQPFTQMSEIELAAVFGKKWGADEEWIRQRVAYVWSEYTKRYKKWERKPKNRGKDFGDYRYTDEGEALYAAVTTEVWKYLAAEGSSSKVLAGGIAQQLLYTPLTRPHLVVYRQEGGKPTGSEPMTVIEKMLDEKVGMGNLPGLPGQELSDMPGSVSEFDPSGTRKVKFGDIALPERLVPGILATVFLGAEAKKRDGGVSLVLDKAEKEMFKSEAEYLKTYMKTADAITKYNVREATRAYTWHLFLTTMAEMSVQAWGSPSQYQLENSGYKGRSSSEKKSQRIVKQIEKLWLPSLFEGSPLFKKEWEFYNDKAGGNLVWDMLNTYR